MSVVPHFTSTDLPVQLKDGYDNAVPERARMGL